MQASHSARFLMEAETPAGELVRCGGLQSWTVNERATLTRIGEIGLDRYLEIVQGLVTTDIAIDILAISNKMLLQVLGQTFYSLKAQHKSFLLREMELLPDNSVLDINYHGCKLENFSKTVRSPDQGVTIAQNGTVQVLYTTINQHPSFSDVLGTDEVAEASDRDASGVFGQTEYVPSDDIIT